MSDNDILNLKPVDLLLLEEEDKIKNINRAKITIHVKKRLANKYFTIVSGLEESKQDTFLKTVKKKFNCNGAKLEDEKSGKEILQFNGDHKDGIFQLLIDLKYADERDIRLRGI